VSINRQLHNDLPGLRGFYATNLKNMLLFYENWDMLDGNSSVTTDELQQIVNHVDIAHSMAVPNVGTFPVEDFFKAPFTHQIEIFTRLNEFINVTIYPSLC
jgi:hypothetical protein